VARRRMPTSTSSPTRRFFSLLEIVIVLIILGLTAALVVPRVGRLPRGVLVKTMIGRIETAFRDAAMRARATGGTVTLSLDSEGNSFRMQDGGSGQPSGWAPPSPDRAAESAPGGGVFAKSRDYGMPKGTLWRTDTGAEIGENAPSFTFYGSGEAAGPELEIIVGKGRYSLAVDRLTGRPLITAKSD